MKYAQALTGGVVLALATGCMPGYIKSNELERKGQGPTACAKACEDLGMRMTAMVLVGDTVPGCVCQPLAAAPAPAPASSDAPPATEAAPPAAPGATPPPPPSAPAPGATPSSSRPGAPAPLADTAGGAAGSTGGYIVIAAAAAARQQQEQQRRSQQKKQ